MKIKLFVDKSECMGCSACAVICPLQCIKMCPDEQGFLYPVVDEISCVACRKCIAVCPIK